MDTQSAAMLPFNLKIITTDKDGIPSLGVPFLAMFNPENIAINETVDWNEKKPVGQAGTDPTFVGIQPRTFTIDLTNPIIY
jgi:hypothetical protein